VATTSGTSVLENSGSTPDPVISLQGVTKRFGNYTVLKDITFDVPRGKITAVLGPSGTGKSVLLKNIIGLLRPEEGQIYVEGEPIVGIRHKDLLRIRRKFGVLFQDGALFGSMRVTDEIDALEVMSVPSLAYLVTTRMLAALTVAVPLYLAALAGSYLATQVTVSAVGHQGAGTYQHYFHEFLTGRDVLLSVIKVVVFAILITSIHCYYGYNAGGGPEGVGKAAGRAIRASVVSIAVSDMLMTILFWGTSSGIKISG